MHKKFGKDCVCGSREISPRTDRQTETDSSQNFAIAPVGDLKMNLNTVKQNPIQRTVRSVHVCALHCAPLLHIILHRTDLIIFPLTLQTIIIAPLMSI